MDLLEYLKKPFIPPTVETLAQRGISFYEKASLRKNLNSQGWDRAGGERAHDWIHKTFELSEGEALLSLKEESPPQTWSLEEINTAYGAIEKKPSQMPQMTLVQGVGVSGLHYAPLGQGAIMQLASQFNYLESPGPFKVPVSSYLWDCTQGPLGAIEAAASALHRHSAEEEGKLPHALHKILTEPESPFYQNGYLMLSQISEPYCERLYEHFAKHIRKMHILPQWVLCEASGALQLQVFSAAPSFQDVNQPPYGSYRAKICSLLVAAQYEAIAKIAAIRSYSMKKPIPLHLTLVGQGVFNNPSFVMREALIKVIEVLKGQDVSVFLHAFTEESARNMEMILEPLCSIERMNRDEFKHTSLPH